MSKNHLFIPIICFLALVAAALFFTGSESAPLNSSIIRIENISIPVQESDNSIVFKAGMLIDADGSPRAYHPKPDDYLGLDNLSFAGEPGDWWALAADENGNPFVQGQSDPAPGYYVSMTSLENESNPNDADPNKYVNSEQISYIVLPKELYENSGARLGDFGVVYNTLNRKIGYAIFADVDGGFMGDNLGEGSIALANQLEIDSNPRTGGVEYPVMIYIVFPGSGLGDGILRTQEEIDQNGERLFNQWGGIGRINTMLD
jgi:hypothetical protein